MKKKIIVIGHTDGYGGAQTAFKRLVGFMIEQGYNVKIICITNDPNNSWIIENKSVFLGHILYKSESLSLKIAKLYLILYSLTISIKFNPNIFITVGLNNTSNLFSRLIGKNTFKIAQDFIADRDYGDKLLNKSLLINDGLAVQSPSMLDYWREKNDYVKKINWLPCFPTLPQKNIVHVIKEQKHSFTMCYFGRLAGNKGLDLLIRAISECETIKSIRLDLWGIGEEAGTLKNLCVDLGVKDRVNFMGAYPDNYAELLVLYDLFVLTSTKSEGLPLVLLEAMSYGLPLLVTNVGAIKDCTINNPDAILIHPDLNSITNGIFCAYSKWIKNDFCSRRQREYYETNFSYSVMAKRWSECLNNPENFFKEQTV